MRENKLFYAFCAITIVTSVFSIGFFHVDEHFQILEFAAYKAHITNANNLPWEFSAGIRPTLQVSIVYACISLFQSLHLFNPFTIVLLMRLITALLCIITFKQLEIFVTSPKNKSFYYAALLVWFIPYLSCRYTSETWSGLFFFLSLALVEKEKKNSLIQYLFAGILMGIGFWCRFQVGFLILGAVIYWIFIKRIKPIYIVFLLIGGIAISIPAVLSDYWFYGKWVCTPYNYFHENIVLGKAANGFGSNPAWFYILELISNTGGIFGILILLSLIFFVKKNYRHPLSISVLLFLIAHTVTAHKELRFLFPLFFVVPVFFAESMSTYIPKIQSIKWMKPIISIIVGINILLLVVIAFKPADTQIQLQKELYAVTKHTASIVYYTNENPYERVGLMTSFYKADNVKLDSIPSASALDTIAKLNAVNYFFVEKGYMGNPSIANKKAILVYQSIPSWIVYLNVNHWVERTGVYRIYKL